MGVMSYNIYDIFNGAIMTKTPAIIVEGVDDVKIYEAIAEQANKNCNIHAVKWINGLTGGANAVEKAIKCLRDKESQRYPIEKFILGIIDRDAKTFRGELPLDGALLVLKYYSIESHFVTEDAIPFVLKNFTRAPGSLLRNLKPAVLMDNIQPKLMELYYFALEALATAIDDEYVSSFSYSDNAGKRNDGGTKSAVLGKSKALDEFAAKYELKPEIATLKAICKGKWLLSVFCESLHQELRSLQGMCATNAIHTCPSCATGNHQECLYKMKEGIANKTIYTLLIDTQLPDLTYITQKVKMLSAA
jgi:hypothetical protein